MSGKRQTKIPYKFSSRYIFCDTLHRIIRILENEQKFKEMIMLTDLPYIFSDDNTPTKFIFNMNQASFCNSCADILWVLTNEKIKSPINLLFNFSENTIEDTVLAILEISFVKRELIPLEYTSKIINMFPKISADIISNLDQMLKDDKKDIYHYQSKIFNYSREELFDVILNMHKILLKKDIISSFSIDNEKGIKEGCIITLNSKDYQKESKMKVLKLKANVNDKKWSIEFIPLNDIYNDEILGLKLIKLENDKTLVCSISEFLENIESDLNEQLNAKKTQGFDFIEEELKLRHIS